MRRENRLFRRRGAVLAGLPAEPASSAAPASALAAALTRSISSSFGKMASTRLIGGVTFGKLSSSADSRFRRSNMAAHSAHCRMCSRAFADSNSVRSPSSSRCIYSITS